MTRYFLRDYTHDGDDAAWRDFVVRLAGDVAQDIVKSSVCENEAEPEAVKGEDAIVLVHADTPESRGEWVAAALSWLTGHVIFVSRDGRLGNQTLVDAKIAANVDNYERCHACFWALAELNEGKIPRIRELLDSLRTSTPDLRLLQPLPAEHVLALRILCEAWLASEGKATATVNGITIRAPIGPDDWFKPFDVLPNKIAAKELAERMGNGGEVGSLTEAVLTAVIKEAVTWAGSKELVEKLRDALKSASR